MKSTLHCFCLAAIALGVLSGSARADMVSTGPAAFSVAQTVYTHSSVSASAGPAALQPNTAQPLAADTPVSGFGAGSLSHASASTLSLWTFITSIRAQQQGDRFSLLETHVSLLQLAEPPAAPVPLPGALWFMVMGLLGMAGVRVSGSSRSQPQGLTPVAAVM